MRSYYSIVVFAFILFGILDVSIQVNAAASAIIDDASNSLVKNERPSRLRHPGFKMSKEADESVAATRSQLLQFVTDAVRSITASNHQVGGGQDGTTSTIRTRFLSGNDRRNDIDNDAGKAFVLIVVFGGAIFAAFGYYCCCKNRSRRGKNDVPPPLSRKKQPHPPPTKDDDHGSIEKKQPHPSPTKDDDHGSIEKEDTNKPSKKGKEITNVSTSC